MVLLLCSQAVWVPEQVPAAVYHSHLCMTHAGLSGSFNSLSVHHGIHTDSYYAYSSAGRRDFLVE